MPKNVGPQPPLWWKFAVIGFLIAAWAALCIALSLPR